MFNEIKKSFMEKGPKKILHENTHHYHDTLMEPPFRDKHPEDVIQEGATEKNSSNLTKKNEYISV